jgi:molybdate transport system substrate-binding protein
VSDTIAATSRRGAIAGVFAAALALLTLGAAAAFERGAATRELVVYAGGVNRAAAMETIREFEQRESAHVVLVVDGCGVLASRIARDLAAGRGAPDLFVPCDGTYLEPFSDIYPVPRPLGDTDLVIAVPPGNPHGLSTLTDLAAPGLRVGAADADKSAMGRLTHRAIAHLGCEAGFAANLKQTGALADPLLAGLAAGALDAAVVFAANATPWRGRVDTVPLRLDGITATATAAARANSPFAQRLVDALSSQRSLGRYRALGFRAPTVPERAP